MNNESESFKLGYAICAVALLVLYVIARIAEKILRKAWGLAKGCWQKRSSSTPDVEVVDA